MEIEFDPAKDAANRAKHGLSLAIGLIILEDMLGSVVDERFVYGETRCLAFGLVAGRLHVCVYVQRGDAYRIISVRKASKKEQSIWL